MSDEGVLLIALAAGVVAFLFYERRTADVGQNALGTAPPPGGPSGSPQDANALEHAIGAAAGTAACAYVGAGPASGACGALGSFVAPYVVKGAVAGAKETAKGAVFLGKAVATGAVGTAKVVASGAKLAVNTGQAVLEHPYSSGLTVASKGLGLASTISSTVDTVTSKAFQKLPTPLKIAAAPAVVTEKVASKAISTGTAVASKATGALSSGAKSAEHAVSSGVHKVLGFL